MNIYSEDKKEEKKSNLTQDTMEYASYNLHLQILEKFLHNIAGKMNICNFLFDMDANKEEIQKVFVIIEVMLLLYRGILLNRSDIHIPNYVFFKFIEDKGGKCIIKNFRDFIEEKVFVLIIVYNSISNNTHITIGDNFLQINDQDVQNIVNIVKQYSVNVINSRFQFILEYVVKDSQIIFQF